MNASQIAAWSGALSTVISTAGVVTVAIIHAIKAMNSNGNNGSGTHADQQG